MFTPGNGDVYDSVYQRVSFQGFSLIPGDSIQVIGLNPHTGTWQTIATAQAGSTPWYYGGEEWYMWDTTAVIPPRFWTKNATDKYSHVLIQPVGSEGALATFQAGYGKTWILAQGQSPLELYEAHGAGTTITLYAK